MMISTKGRYALRVMIELAEQPARGFVPLQEIAEHQKISKEYLNNILKVLVASGHLSSLRGKGGGYCLAKSPDTCCVGDILKAVEGDISPVSCTQENNICPNSYHCRTYPMWQALNEVIGDFLGHVYLSDFLAGGRFYEKQDP